MEFLLSILSNIIAGVVVVWLVVTIPSLFRSRQRSSTQVEASVIIDPSWKRHQEKPQTFFELLIELANDLRDVFLPMFGVLGAILLFLLYTLRWFTTTSVGSHIVGWVLTLLISAVCYWLFKSRIGSKSLNPETRWQGVEAFVARVALPAILSLLVLAAVWLVYFTHGMQVIRAQTPPTREPNVATQLDRLDARLTELKQDLMVIRATTQPLP